MSTAMSTKKLEALAAELAKDIKTPKDLSNLSARLTKLTVEAALNAEIEDHLGYSRHGRQAGAGGNSRNGYSSKTLKGDHGEIEISTPRDRDASFSPQIVSKGQTRISGMDDQILSLYAKGMSTRDIVAAFQEMYGADISTGLISKVTNAVLDCVFQRHPPTDSDNIRPLIPKVSAR